MTWLRSRWERLNGPQRIGGVDLARGLAVLGMIAAHLLWITEPFDWTDAATWIAVVDGRSSILFATLAGVSIGLVTGGRAPLTGRGLTTARLRLVVRAILLWIIGIVLILTGVPVFVILPAYAILFLLALPLLALPARVVLPLAGGLALVMPFVQVWLDELPFWRTVAGHDVGLLIGWHYPFPVWIAFVVAGLGVARAGVTRLKVQGWMLAAGAVLAFAGYSLGVFEDEASVWSADPHSSGLFEVIGSGGFALAVIAASLLVCRTVLTWLVLPLRAVGAMPLTAYVAQIVAWAIVAASVLGDTGDLAGFRDLEPFWPLTLTVLVACTAWALVIGRGPLEWFTDTSSRALTRSR
ncbi:heparan-alpha-glucosaminide N-acetyltransferase domain-containing protein [Microbacterium aoyamense]|uniref:Heparan-alpha-glucosaminide N-acetyltransferase domain-containing protein n=1 Tax=Microbacterium aoyamense TaxID=344166 RepID=A0ABN2PVT8_9MICO